MIVGSFAIVGPIVSTLDVAAYFSRREAWTYLIKVLIYPTQYSLPEVFRANPYPDIVNGSLWSLRLEFALYVIIAVAGYCGLMRAGVPRFFTLACLAAGLVLTTTPALNHLPFAHQAIMCALNGIPFFVGASFAQNNWERKQLTRALLLLAVLALPLLFLHAVKVYIALLVPFVTLLLAKSLSCDLSKLGDYSYGVYLWAFPMQQCVIAYNPSIPPLKLFAAAGALTLFCAVLSWHLIEKRALALKPRRT